MKDSNDATVGERLVERISLTQTLLDDNERLRAEIARLRLTAEKRGRLSISQLSAAAAMLRSLLERMK